MMKRVWQQLYKLKKKFGLNERSKKRIIKQFAGKSGIEIGGPSPIFLGKLPIYKIIKGLDGCNFSSNTIWEGNIREGEYYQYYENKKGFQFIAEASNLNKIADKAYDFLLASHCLEHCANAIKTIQEWKRVLKPCGYMLLILPAKSFTFDHKRNITTLDHLIEDYNNGVDETDLTHLEEILSLHDLKLDHSAGEFEQFKKRSLHNFENRCLHHHVFDFNLLKQLFHYCNIEVINTIFISPFHQVVLGRKNDFNLYTELGIFNWAML